MSHATDPPPAPRTDLLHSVSVGGTSYAHIAALLTAGVVLSMGTWSMGAYAASVVPYSVPKLPDYSAARAAQEPPHTPPPTHQPPCGDNPGAPDPGAGYPGSVYAVTSLRLGTLQATQGQRDTATVHLRTQADDVQLRGRTTLSIQPTSGDRRAVQLDQRLSNGTAQFTLPDDLRNGDYTVQATYVPQCADTAASTQTEVEDLTVTGN